MIANLLNNLRRLSRQLLLENPLIFWGFIVVNLLGFLVGTVGWYGAQLPLTPMVWWLFVPDCPLVALLFAIALWGLRTEKRWTVFNLWTAMGSIKYGVWTCTIWLAYWAQTGDYNALSLSMFATHVGLIAQGVVLLLLIERWRMWQAVPVFMYYIVADLVDYRLGHHPMYPAQVSAALVQWHTVAMTVILGVALTVSGWWMEQSAVARSRAASYINSRA